MLSCWGEKKTAGEWSRDPRVPVSDSSIRRRLKKGWSVEEALSLPSGQEPSTLKKAPSSEPATATTPPKLALVPAPKASKSEALVCWGESKTLESWVEDTRVGADLPTIKSRLADGWTAEEALSTPPGAEKGIYTDVYEAVKKTKTVYMKGSMKGIANQIAEYEEDGWTTEYIFQNKLEFLVVFATVG